MCRKGVQGNGARSDERPCASIGSWAAEGKSGGDSQVTGWYKLQAMDATSSRNKEKVVGRTFVEPELLRWNGRSSYC